MPKLENWSVKEMNGMHRLTGNIYGDRRFDDGDLVVTSSVVRREGEIIVTLSGTHYSLGVVDPEYEKLFPNARERVMKIVQERWRK